MADETIPPPLTPGSRVAEFTVRSSDEMTLELKGAALVPFLAIVGAIASGGAATYLFLLDAGMDLPGHELPHKLFYRSGVLIALLAVAGIIYGIWALGEKVHFDGNQKIIRRSLWLMRAQEWPAKKLDSIRISVGKDDESAIEWLTLSIYKKSLTPAIRFERVRADSEAGARLVNAARRISLMMGLPIMFGKAQRNWSYIETPERNEKMLRLTEILESLR